VELGKVIVDEPIDFLFGQRHDPRHDAKSSLRIGKFKWPHQNPRIVGLDEDVSPLQLHGNLPVFRIIQMSVRCRVVAGRYRQHMASIPLAWIVLFA